MKSVLSILALLVSTIFASPIPDAEPQPQPSGFEEMGALSAALSERNNAASLTPLAKRQDELSDTRNELAECKPVTVIFARGTIELGNVGSLTGPPFFVALESVIGGENFAVQ